MITKDKITDFKQILLTITIRNVKRIVRRVYILILGIKRLLYKQPPTSFTNVLIITDFLFHTVSQYSSSITSGCVCIIVSVIQLSDETYAMLVSVMTDIQHLKVIRCYRYNSSLQVLTILVYPGSRI